MTRRSARIGFRYVAGAVALSPLIACAGLLGIDDRAADTLGTDASIDSSSDARPAALIDGSAGSGDATVPPDATGNSARDTDAADGTATEGAAPDGGGSATDARTADAGTPDTSAQNTQESGAPGDAGADAGMSAGDANGQPDVAACADPCRLAAGLNHPFLMASDANNVYWTEYGDVEGSANGSVKSCPVTGCGPSGPTVYAFALTNPRGITVDAQNVYWGTASNVGVVGGIWSSPLGGGGTAKLVTRAGWPYGVAVDATYVYWVDVIDLTVHRAPKGGGGADHVIYDGGGGLVTGKPEQCAIDSAFVFFTDDSDNVYRVPVGGGDPIMMTFGFLPGGWPLTVDRSYVYFGRPGQIARMTKVSTSGASPIAINIPDPGGLAIDPATGTTIYWADWGSGLANDGTIGKVEIDGGGQVVLVGSLVTPQAITVNGSYVFWLSNGTLGDAGAALPATGALYRRNK